MTFTFTAKIGRKILAKSPGVTSEEVRQMLDRVLTKHDLQPGLEINIEADTPKEVS